MTAHLVILSLTRWLSEWDFLILASSEHCRAWMFVCLSISGSEYTCCRSEAAAACSATAWDLTASKRKLRRREDEGGCAVHMHILWRRMQNIDKYVICDWLNILYSVCKKRFLKSEDGLDTCRHMQIIDNSNTLRKTSFLEKRMGKGGCVHVDAYLACKILTTVVHCQWDWDGQEALNKKILQLDQKIYI